ncbi:MAG: hypothetical protein L0215_11835 [Gemmataceae bacterium]|nr:hypothetical protein [Gemmataceae bacterium]
MNPARCLVIEVAPVGIHAAKARGMKAIGVTFVGHHPAAPNRRGPGGGVAGSVSPEVIRFHLQ